MDQMVSFLSGSNTTQPSASEQDVTVTDPNPSIPECFTVEHLSQGTYNMYLIDTRYTTKTGLDVLPVGREGAAGVVTKTHETVTEKWIFWTAERLNVPPTLPETNTNNANEVLISSQILFANVLQKDYGQTVWRVSGVYHYKMIKAQPIGSSIYPISTTPAELASAISRFYGPSNFSPNIIDASAGAPTLPSLLLNQVIQQN